MKNSKATTLQFESDFDFETANAQFKDDITKGTSGWFDALQLGLNGGKATLLSGRLCVTCSC